MTKKQRLEYKPKEEDAAALRESSSLGFNPVFTGEYALFDDHFDSTRRSKSNPTTFGLNRFVFG
jgi:hypothetical protein